MRTLEIAVAIVQAAVSLIILGAGTAKLVDLSGFAATLSGLGVTQRLAGPAAQWRPQVRCRCFGALADSQVQPAVDSPHHRAGTGQRTGNGTDE